MQLNKASREIRSVKSVSPVVVQPLLLQSVAGLYLLLKFHPTPLLSTIPTESQSKGPRTRQLALPH